MKFASSSLRRPITVLMLFLGLFVMGLLAINRLPLEFLPSTSGNHMWVSLPYRGSSPQNIEKDILIPAEDALATLPNLESMWARASEHSAGISLRFNEDADTDMMVIEVRDRLDRIIDDLPEDFERYYIHKHDTGSIPTLWMGFNLNNFDEAPRIKEDIETKLKAVEGVSQIDIEEIYTDNLVIKVDENKLKAFKIPLNLITSKIVNNNKNYSLGKIESEYNSFYVRSINEFSKIEELKNLQIRDSIKLKDIAEVVNEKYDEDRYERINGELGLRFSVMKESTANSVRVADAVLNRLETIEKKYDITIFPFFNQGQQIKDSIMNLVQNGFWGAILAVFVLLFFLRKFKMTLIIAFEIPLSIIFTLGIMYFLNISLNMISMMGLMVAIGMLVDNAVVVTESIYKLLQEGYTLVKAIIKGVNEIGIAVFTASLTTMIVFLPLLFGQGQMGTYLKYVAATIIIALSMSLISSLLLIPLFSFVFLKDAGSKKDITENIKGFYEKTLNWILNHRIYTALFAFLFIFLSFVPLKNVNFENMRSGGPDLMLRFINRGGLSEKEFERNVLPIEKKILQNKEKLHIDFITTRVRSRHIRLRIFPNDKGKRVGKNVIIKELRKNYLNKKMPGIEVRFGWGHSSGGGASQHKGVYNVNLYGKNFYSLYDIAEEVAPLMESIEGVNTVDFGEDTSTEEYQVHLNREKASFLNINLYQVLHNISSLIGSREIDKLDMNGKEMDLIVERKGRDNLTLRDVNSSSIYLNSGEEIRLQDVANFEKKPSMRRIIHDNREATLNLTLNTDYESYQELQSSILNLFKNYDFPNGYGFKFGEEFRKTREDFNEFMFMILLALLLVYMVMASLFESLNMPIAIVLGLPFSILGSIWGIWISGTPLNVMTFMGFIVLVGIAVNNGIVIIDHINRIRMKGLDKKSAIIKGGKDRLRPVLMTTFTTIIGIFPMSLGFSDTIFIKYSTLSRTVIFGLLTSMFITLLLIPLIYSVFDDISEFHVKMFRKVFGIKEE